MKRIYLVILSFLSMISVLDSCTDDQISQEEIDALMGSFDSIVIAQEKGPDLDYYYENMVQHISFPSGDSISVYADLYEVDDTPIQILLCHQAGFSRGEYIETGIFLSQLGYNAMAIDQRSGESAQGIENKTAIDAFLNGKNQEYIDAKQDIETAIDYLYSCNGGLQITLIGSSYSATLALLIAKENQKVKKVIAFSPGEYLEGINVSESLDSLEKPIFVTSSKLEISQTSQLIELVDSNWVTQYKPDVEGIHGSRALWRSTEGHKAYWKEFLKFLKTTI